MTPTPKETTAPPVTTTAAPATTTAAPVTTTEAVITAVETTAEKTTEQSADTTTGARQLQPEKWGDTNLDDKVDVSDAVLLCRFLVGDTSATITDQGLANARMIKKGEPPTSDCVVKIIKYIAKMINKEDLAPED